jgi:murein L,D-transpeptidase YcbB/YkuD
MPTPRAAYVTLPLAAAAVLMAGWAALHHDWSGKSAQSVAQLVPPPPRPHWSATTVNQLLAAVEASSDEGLRPADYQKGALADAVESHLGGPALDALATKSAAALAHDYAYGRIVHRERFNWHIGRPTASQAARDAELANAVNGGRLTDYLMSLLPHDPRYVALRGALAHTPRSESSRIAHIRASMERWRWMPRTLGGNYIWVNVPTYRLALYQGDTAVAFHDVVVGARKTPTPLISANVGSIIVNPWWTLPPTVLAEGRIRPGSNGYVVARAGNGQIRIRQRPGPKNALGRVKIDMPNAYAIYLHDTPAKVLFDKPDRALSHGCIRVKDIARLASQLANPDTVDNAMATYTTRTLQVQKTMPVYVVYFTAAPDDEGDVETYPDPYDQDDAMIAALDHSHARTTAANSHAS